MTPAADLIEALREMLEDAGASGGGLDPADFWAFVALLAEGRGIGDELAEQGERAALAMPAAPPRTLDARRVRAFQIGTLRALLRRLRVLRVVDGGPPDDGTGALPAGFMSAMLEMDLEIMLAGQTGEGDGTPFCLNTAARGERHRRKIARKAFVRGVIRAAARAGTGAQAMAADVWDVPKPTWDKWTQELTAGERDALRAGATSEPELRTAEIRVLLDAARGPDA